MMNDQPMMGDPNQSMQADPMQQGQPPVQSAPSQPPVPEQGEGNSEDELREDQLENLLDFALSEANLAKKLRNRKTDTGTLLLDEIGAAVYKGWEDDEESRKEWMEKNEKWLKMAMLVRENRTYPWPNASNIKYPLLATAAMQFSARAYPALVPSDGKVVKAKAIPYDTDGKLADKAERIARHMSYQVMCKMPNWEEDMDKLLLTMAITGICFKKTYHNKLLGVHHSHLVMPENLCVNYWAKSLEKAYRKTEILRYTENEYIEKVNNNEEFLDIDLPEPTHDTDSSKEMKPNTGIQAGEPDSSTPHVFLAQHTYWDLDNDGYEEPYIITIHRDTKQVVRIIARWDQDGVHKDEKGQVIRIEPVEYFTDFPFIPNPDGSLYAMGFGLLLGPLNESVNSIVNQLIDAGTLSNLQSGFIGKGLRLQMKSATFQPGEWKAVNATGDDLNKQIVPLPVKDPSPVLLQLLQMLITSGNQLASIAEIMVGKMPGQNTPATTTQETVKQGMAVFTAIYKRVYRSLAKEFKKIYRLNRIVPGMVEEEAETLGVPLQGVDYDDDNLIIPGGDPTGDSESTKQMKVQQVGQMFIPLGTLNPLAYTEWGMQVFEVPNYQKLLMQPQGGDPEQKKMEMEMQLKQQESQLNAQSKQQEMQAEKAIAQLELQMKQAELEFKQQKAKLDFQIQQMKAHGDMQAQQMKQHMDQQQMAHDAMVNQQKSQLDLKAAQAQHEMKLRHGEESFKQQSAQAKEKSKMQGGSKKKGE